MIISIVIDRALPTSLQRQIYDQWRTGILTGRFRRGERVPSSRAFAKSYLVARVTVVAAYDQLLEEGYFETKHGSGTFISSHVPDEGLRPIRIAASTRTAANRARLSEYGLRIVGNPPAPASPLRRLDLSQVGPDLAHFPFFLWRRLLSRHLRRESPDLFDLSAQPAGHEGLRRAIAIHVARTRAVRCSIEQVIVVNGSQQALDLCARLLLNPGDDAAVEEPGYPGARQLFSAHGASLKALKVTDSGASIEGLTRKTRVVHVTPSHQFPTGVSMSLARRFELLEWARTRGAVVLEDDYDSDYRYSGSPLPAVHSLADGAGVIYIGTFSNVMFRGLRIGYLVVPKELIEPFTSAKWMADRHTPRLEQAALADFIEQGHLARHVLRMRRVYKHRREVLVEALQRYFGSDVSIRGDAAGMHLAAAFKDGMRVRASAERNGVRLMSTSSCYLSKSVSNEFILAFSGLGERTILEAVRGLAN